MKPQSVPWIVPINPKNLSINEDFNKWEEYEDICMIQIMEHRMYEKGL